MTRAEAHRLLDAVRGGENLSEAAITLALRLTGDLWAPAEPSAATFATIPSFLNRSGRVMRGAGDVVSMPDMRPDRARIAQGERS
jgi:hypothetical protein